MARSTPFLPAKAEAANGESANAEAADSSQSDRAHASTLVPTIVLDKRNGEDRAAPAQAPDRATPVAASFADLADPDDGATTTLAPGTILKDTYSILSLIGRGGMGEVYEVKHARLAGRYALKLLPPAFAMRHISLTRFRREADITSALRHPNIVQVIDFDHTPAGQPFLVMEYLDGGDLAELMTATGPMPLARVLNIVGQIVSALSAVHRNGIVHRDLKPQNVLLVRDSHSGQDRVKLVDFGLSKRSDGAFLNLASSISRERTLLGTPRYMAPEQAAGNVDEIDATTDQFALGAIVYEMLTGAFAFNDEHMAVLLYKISSQEPAPIRSLVPDIPARVERAVRRAMSKRKADRFANTTDFFDALCGESKALTAPAEDAPADVDNDAGVPRSSPGLSASPVRAATTSGADAPPSVAAAAAAAFSTKRKLAALAIGAAAAVGVALAFRTLNPTLVPTAASSRTPASASVLPTPVPLIAPSEKPVPPDKPTEDPSAFMAASRSVADHGTAGDRGTAGGRPESAPSGSRAAVGTRSRRTRHWPATAGAGSSAVAASSATAPSAIGKKPASQATVGRLVEDL